MCRAALAALATALGGQVLAAEWDVSLWGQRRAFTEHVHKLAELVEEKTGGGFTLNISYGDLANPRENLDGISIGAFEMAQFCSGYHPDKSPAMTVLELPFLGWSTLEEVVAVSNAVYAHPASKADMERWKARILMASPMPQYNIVGKGEPRDTVEEFKGMRVRATGGLGKAFEAAGAVPNALTSPEVYEAMESGVVDTVAFAPHAHLSFRTLDLATWWTENLNLGAENCPVVVSAHAYEALSPEHRQALASSVDEAIGHYVENYQKLLDEWSATLSRTGVQRIRIPDEEIARFRELAVPVREQWRADMEAKGLPGQELLDVVEKTLEDLRANE